MSTLKVDTLDTSNGTGNITLSRPIVGDGSNLTGVAPTKATIEALGIELPAANLTGTVADARLPNPLPAIDGSNLTGVAPTKATIEALGIALPAANLTGSIANARIPQSAVTQHVTPFDPAQLEMNQAILAFKIASSNQLTKFSMVDQVIDEYQDATGIDAGNSTNEMTGGDTTAKYYWGRAVGVNSTNYFGDDSDGTLNTSGNVTETVLSKSGSYDGDMLVKNYTNLTINAGHTLTVDQPCRGMLVFVSGDCVINGTLSMKEKGALVNPHAGGGSDVNAVNSTGIQLCFQTASGSTSFNNADTNFNGCGTTARTAIANFGDPSSNGDTVTVPRAGGAGGAATHNGQTDGGVIANGSGGGGSGAGWAGGTSGAGTAGTCFSGGSGGGGANGGSASAGTAYGGAGGAGNSAHNAWCGGGAGNPGGTSGHFSAHTGGTVTTAGGLGGLLYLIVQGNLTIGAAGKITAEGGTGGNMTNGSGATYGGDYTSGGGNGGGGRTIVAYAGTLSNSGSITAAGGVGNNVTAAHSGPGGDGGDGVTTTIPIVTTTYNISDLTLQSEATTAETVPTSADLVVLIEDGAGTATVNTDIKGYVSRDGSAFSSAVTFIDEGDWGTNKRILVARNVDISGITSGTSMKYKLTTHNQVASSKETKIHATSLAWA